MFSLPCLELDRPSLPWAWPSHELASRSYMTRQSFRSQVLASPPAGVFQNFLTVPRSSCTAAVIAIPTSTVLLVVPSAIVEMVAFRAVRTGRNGF